MRIAQVITLYLPEFVGGATLACARVARGLSARGHEVAVFCGHPGAEATPEGVHDWQVDGVPVTGVDAASGYVTLDVRGYRHPEVAEHFGRFLDRVRPDVVHLHSLQALGATLVDAAVARRVPVVVTMHDWWWFCVRLFLVDEAGFVCAPRIDSTRCHCAPDFDLVARRRALDRALTLVDRVLTPSRFLADAAIANGVDPARVEVCPNGVDVPAAHVRRRPGPVRFGYFGGPDNRLKGLPTLRAAAGTLDVGGWTLRLFGVSRAEADVPFALLDRVTTARPFAPAALGDVLATLDCLVVPSLMRESYSLVTREALAAGVPVIASDSGGPQEIVRDVVNGFIFATGDAADLAAHMRRVVLEPALRAHLAAGAAETPVPTMTAQLDQLERVYAAVCRPPVRAADAATRTAAAPHGTTLRRVLFVSGIDGAPFRYRVSHLREQLRARGVASAALYYTDSGIDTAIADTDLVIVSRVPMSAFVRRWLAQARARACPLVFSCDDLVFERAAAPADALALLPAEQRAGWLAYGERYAETLRACDAFLGSTEPLVAAAARAGVAGVVVRNGLGAAELRAAETARQAAHRDAALSAAAASRRARCGDEASVRFAYLSGTVMHDLDFATIEPAVAELLARHAAARLVVVGYLRTGAALAPFAGRIDRLPFLPWPRLFATLAGVDVNLAPLRDDAFSDAKSEVKYLEAAAVGVPTIASPTAAFRHAIRHGVNGLLAADDEGWRAALELLVTSPSMRRRLGSAARDDVVLHASPAARATALIDALEGIRRNYPASPAATAEVRAAVQDSMSHAVPEGRYDLEPDDALPGAQQPARDDCSPPLVSGRTIGQRFEVDADGLARIDVAVRAVPDGTMPALMLHVASDPSVAAAGTSDPTRGAPHAAGAVGHGTLRTVAIGGARIAEDAWIAAEFDPIDGCAGRTLYFWVELAAGGAARVAGEAVPAVMLRTYTRGWGEASPIGLHVDHRAVAGSLAFRTFHRAGGLTFRDASPSPSPSPP